MNLPPDRLQTGPDATPLAQDLAYCLEKAAPEGSTGYYTLRFAPAHLRDALLALAALQCELDAVVEQCSELRVAEGKLAYWSEELGRVGARRASHPVARALSTLLDDQQLRREDVQALLTSTHDRLRTPQVLDEQELMDLCRLGAGRIGRIIARLYQRGDRDQALAGEAAAAVERVRLLQAPQRAGQPAHTGVPRDALVELKVDRAAFDRGADGPGIDSLQATLMRRCLDHLDALGPQRGSDATRLPPPLLSRVRIARRELDNGIRRQRRLPQPLLPISRLWICWRDARRER
ncbi:MAG: squalene/phytoene synthase family protein, partial [Gammaproteobacteria bacterium]|nr:squalene/phytoene synthase family protein [Gammaproteobacteria bacterium]